MTGIYYPEMLDVLRATGCQVAESSTTAGWQTRARSSGGFPAPPLGVWWHHTASSATPANDLAWMIRNCPDAPVGNLLLDRTGCFWPVAAGASNCAGKGGPWTFSRGTVPADSGNTRGWQIEAANNGVGEAWPVAQVDAYFKASNALNAHVGNQPGDVITHNAWAPTRKIDPATATAVQGPWRPRSCTTSGTWDLADIVAECVARAAGAYPTPEPDPEPTPAPDEEDDVKLYVVLDPADGQTQWVTDMWSRKTRIPDPGVAAEGVQLFGWIGMSGCDPFGLGAGWGPYLDSLAITPD